MKIQSIEKLIVVDDDWRQAASTSNEFSLVIPKNNILAVTGGLVELIRLTAETKPTVILLDNRYSENRASWQLEPAFMALEQISGVPAKPIRKPDRGNMSISGVMPDDLNQPNATHISLILRYSGYSGKIIAVSNDPPTHEYIDHETKALNKHLAEQGLATISNPPINGKILKNNSFPYKSWAVFSNEGWQDNFEEVSYSIAITQLLEAL